ncbi:hypothetical protein ABZN20_17415 [Methylococcus sp. ANG]|uniref:hypothetical protein n=1 Tax=unclassified Methylococcus TaxID=2618889 RepID=UPI001C52FA3E|nr:hypothetical protein [Methylococcus sp. Mc7]QXP86235.1 hypothetical protein KW115_10455 [Methylococcus sp. Mc7]
MGARVGRLESAVAEKNGRGLRPSYGIIDAQSVKAQYDSEDRGINGGKKSEWVHLP